MAVVRSFVDYCAICTSWNSVTAEHNTTALYKSHASLSSLPIMTVSDYSTA